MVEYINELLDLDGIRPSQSFRHRVPCCGEVTVTLGYLAICISLIDLMPGEDMRADQQHLLVTGGGRLPVFISEAIVLVDDDKVHRASAGVCARGDVEDGPQLPSQWCLA